MIDQYSLKFKQPLIEKDFQECRSKQDLKEFNSFAFLCIINASSKIIYGFMLGQYIYTGIITIYLMTIFILRIVVKRKWINISYILVFIQFGLLLSYNMNFVLQENKVLTDCSSQWLNGFEACIMHTYVYLQGTNFLLQTFTLTLIYIEYLFSLQMYSPELINIQVGFFLLIIGVISMRYQFELNKRQQYLEIISNQKWLHVVELAQNQWTILVKFDQQEQLAIQKSTSQVIKQLQIIENDVQFRILLRDLQLEDHKARNGKLKQKKQPNLEELTRQKLFSNSQSVHDRSVDQYDFYHPQSKQTYQVTIMDFFYDCEKRVLLIIKEDTYQQSKQKLKLKLAFYKRIILDQTMQTSSICNKLLSICNKESNLKQRISASEHSITLIKESVQAVFNLNNIKCWLNVNDDDISNLTIINRPILRQLLKPSWCYKSEFLSHFSIRTNIYSLQLMVFNMIYFIRTILQIKPQNLSITFEQLENDVCKYLRIQFQADRTDIEQLPLKLIKHIKKRIIYPNENIGSIDHSNNRYFGLLFDRNLKKLFRYLSDIPQTQLLAMSLAFSLTVTKYLLTTYGTSNSISYQRLIDGRTILSIELIHISNTQEADYNCSNSMILKNRSIFSRLGQIRQGLLY